MAVRLKPGAHNGEDGEGSAASGTELSPDIFRQLYVGLDLSADTNPVIGITSAIAGEGRSTVAVGLARVLAEDLGTLVSLVDVDLEKPSLAELFGVAPGEGLAEVLRGERRLADVRCLVSHNLCLIPGGNIRDDAGVLLHRLPAADPFHGPGALGGVVILDLPPVLSHAYSALAASIADATVLVVRAGVTPADIVREAVGRLEERPPSGVVFNGPDAAEPSWRPWRRGRR